MNIVNNADRALISRKAYENGGSWLVDRWVCPGDRVGRGENNVCAVYPGRANGMSVKSNNMETGNNRKRTGQTSSSTQTRRTPPHWPRRRPMRILTVRKRLSREQINLSLFETAGRSIPGCKSSQDC